MPHAPANRRAGQAAQVASYAVNVFVVAVHLLDLFHYNLALVSDGTLLGQVEVKQRVVHPVASVAPVQYVTVAAGHEIDRSCTLMSYCKVKLPIRQKIIVFVSSS